MPSGYGYLRCTARRACEPVRVHLDSRFTHTDVRCGALLEWVPELVFGKAYVLGSHTLVHPGGLELRPILVGVLECA